LKVITVRHTLSKKDSARPAKRSITTPPVYCANIQQWVIGALATVTLCGILVVGLWPFHAPKNQVTWLGSENGLSFGDYGTILSSDFFWGTGSDSPYCSLEIWLEPALASNDGTIIAFYSPSSPRQFSLRQSLTDLALQRDITHQDHQTNLVRLYVDEAFRKSHIFVTVTSNGQDTAVYIDGQLVRRSSRFGLSINDLTGQLIGGNSPKQHNSWSGKLRGLAIYRSELNATQVAQHYEDWTRTGNPTVTQEERVLALYLFDEHTGTIVHNRARPETDLYIPERYVVVHQVLLEPPWREFRAQWSYLKDVFINIVGFIPLGFFFYGYLSSARRIRCATLATVFLGSMVSLTIEILQAYLPTRDSGMTDVITNTLGTCVGIVVCRAATLPLALAAKPWAGHFGVPTN
jgi:VanZ family protein